MTTRRGSSPPPPVSAETPRTREDGWRLEWLAHRLAVLVADELELRQAERELPSAWTTSAQVAAHLQVDTEWVTSHGPELGGVRLGDGPKAPWRFPPLERVDELLAARTACPEGRKSDAPQAASLSRTRPRRRRVSGTGVPLLPVRGDEPTC